MTSKCPKGCDGEQVAGEVFFALRRTPTHRTKQGALVLARYNRVRLRQYQCTACGKAYEVDEAPKKVAIKKPAKPGMNRKKGKRGKQPKKRKRNKAN